MGEEIIPAARQLGETEENELDLPDEKGARSGTDRISEWLVELRGTWIRAIFTRKLKPTVSPSLT
jgi:hypothetical protein